MSSIMRWRSALPGRCEGSEVIGGSSLELKVAGPSMLGIGCPDRHALLLMPFPSAAAERTHPEAAPSRESGFVPCPEADPHGGIVDRLHWGWKPDHRFAQRHR